MSCHPCVQYIRPARKQLKLYSDYSMKSPKMEQAALQCMKCQSNDKELKTDALMARKFLERKSTTSGAKWNANWSATKILQEFPTPPLFKPLEGGAKRPFVIITKKKKKSQKQKK